MIPICSHCARPLGFRRIWSFWKNVRNCTKIRVKNAPFLWKFLNHHRGFCIFVLSFRCNFSKNNFDFDQKCRNKAKIPICFLFMISINFETLLFKFELAVLKTAKFFLNNHIPGHKLCEYWYSTSKKTLGSQKKLTKMYWCRVTVGGGGRGCRV